MGIPPGWLIRPRCTNSPKLTGSGFQGSPCGCTSTTPVGWGSPTSWPPSKPGWTVLTLAWVASEVALRGGGHGEHLHGGPRPHAARDGDRDRGGPGSPYRLRATPRGVAGARAAGTGHEGRDLRAPDGGAVSRLKGFVSPDAEAW